MRSRVIAGLALVVCGLGAQASSAGAKKPVLWLRTAGFERAAPGTEATAQLFIGGGSCLGVVQEATLTSNGKAGDKIAGGAVKPNEFKCAGEKLAGAITSITARPSGEADMIMTVKGSFHVLVEPWCVYALPKTFSLPASPESAAEATLTAPLDKAASFGTCASSRAIPVGIEVKDAGDNEPFFAEVL